MLASSRALFLSLWMDFLKGLCVVSKAYPHLGLNTLEAGSVFRLAELNRKEKIIEIHW